MCVCIFYFYSRVKMMLTETMSIKIGINYTGTDRQLDGCVNDARHVRDFLTESEFSVCPHQFQSN